MFSKIGPILNDNMRKMETFTDFPTKSDYTGIFQFMPIHCLFQNHHHELKISI